MKKTFLFSLFESWGISGWLVLAFFVTSLAFVIIDPLESTLTEILRPSGQKLLSVADNKFSRNSPVRQVYKVSTPSGLMLEVYGAADKSGNRKLLETIRLPDKHDAYFNINGRATNLAFRDMNNDGSAEIVAPTYDDDWNPRLNVFTYDKDTESFRALNE